MKNTRSCPDPIRMPRDTNFSPVLVGYGANLPSDLGSPLETLSAGLAALDEAGLRVVARSRWYRTAAFPPGSGPDFVNGACALETALSPKEILHTLHSVEAELGRERRKRWGPRVCDFDLLAVGDAVLPDAEGVGRWMSLDPLEAGNRPAPSDLVLPHPRMTERAFVLAPLMDIAPDWRHPLTGQTVQDHFAALPEADRADVEEIVRI
ncbi:MAG: 2-amino-4-hydroxy-6-hydroxymethyldihydropteridine diphosphokinase [Pseudomonadota bacterium]